LGPETTEPDGGQPDISADQPLCGGGGRNRTKPESSRVVGTFAGTCDARFMEPLVTRCAIQCRRPAVGVPRNGTPLRDLRGPSGYEAPVGRRPSASRRAWTPRTARRSPGRAVRTVNHGPAVLTSQSWHHALQRSQRRWDRTAGAGDTLPRHRLDGGNLSNAQGMVR